MVVSTQRGGEKTVTLCVSVSTRVSDTSAQSDTAGHFPKNLKASFEMRQNEAEMAEIA